MRYAGEWSGADTTAINASAATITTGVAITESAIVGVYVIRDGAVAVEYFSKDRITASTVTITISGAPALAATDEYIVEYIGPVRAHTASINANRTTVVDRSDSLGEEVADETDATVATNFWFLDVTGFDNLQINWSLTDGVLRILTSAGGGTLPAEGGTPGVQWALEHTVDTGAGLTDTDAYQFSSGAVYILLEWVPYDGTSVIQVWLGRHPNV